MTFENTWEGNEICLTGPARSVRPVGGLGGFDRIVPCEPVPVATFETMPFHCGESADGLRRQRGQFGEF